MIILLKMLCCLTPLAVLTSLAAQDSRPLTPNLPQSSYLASRAANMASSYVALDSWAYAAFDRLAALGVGVYLPKLPHLPKLDFRAEGFLTPPRAIFPGFYYFNVRYLSGYTNNRQLIASWIGREGSGIELWGTWWFSPRVSLQANYLEMTSNPQFLRGGDLHDASVASDLRLAREWSIHLSGQFDCWQFPLLSPNASDDMTVSAQLTWSPQPRSL
jgi:hypothetical protein